MEQLAILSSASAILQDEIFDAHWEMLLALNKKTY